MLRIFVALAATALLAATPAGAETFHTAPGAANATPPCPASAPCPLDVAMAAPTSDADEVVLAGGTYDLDALSSTPSQNNGALVPAAGAHPRIVGHASIGFFGTVIRDLTIATQGARGLTLGDSTAERLVVDHDSTNVPGGSFAVEAAFASTLRDSVVIERGDDGTAVVAGAMHASAPSIVENVTAIATGARSVGVRATQTPCAPYAGNARVRNTIARGTLGDLGTRVGDEDGSCHLEIILDVDTTNYRTIARSPNAVNTIVLGPGNQTAPAQTDDAAIFTDARYRQKQTSPTVDAGIAGAQTGSTDPDGDPRSNGGRPDIGADEMLEASFATATLTPRSPTTADLVATGLIVVPPRLSYTSMVEVGTTTAYGREIQTIDGASSTGVWSRTVVDLPAGALLHYRVNSTVSNGTQSRTTPGPDMTLQMPAAPALPVPPTVPAPAPKPKPKLKLKAATVIKLGTPARRCSSRRVLTLGLTAPKGAKLVKAKVTLRDKTTTYSGKKLKAKIDLRGLPKRAFKLKVSVLLADGRTATLTKSYKSCSARPRARATASSAVAISPA